MEKDYAVIFKRGEFVEGKGLSLEAVDYVEGREVEVKGNKYFIINPLFRQHCLETLDEGDELHEFYKNNKNLKFMESKTHLVTEFVYGTPMNTHVLKDLIVYNFGFLSEKFGIDVSNEDYQHNVNQLKEKYVLALKNYVFYQNVTPEGVVQTSVQRKDPMIYNVPMDGPISNIFEEELGLDIPEDYDLSSDYEDMYKPTPTEIDMRKIYDEVRKYIKGQDKHIVPLLNAINDNLTAEIPEEKVNILVCGPTGCGKTAVIERIASLIGLPVKIEDSTQFTKAGYVGRDISEAFEDLIEVANGDLELAQIGILVFDEADKKASKGTDDVAGQSVLQSMLKLLEGKDYTYETGSGISRKLRTFKTLNTTIVLSGAFSDLANTVSLKTAPGFGREEVKNKVDVVYGVDNLGEYGIPKECVGRLDLEIFDELSVSTLKEILTTGKVNPLELFTKKMKRRFNTSVEVTDEFVDALAQKAHDSGCGARSLYKEFRKATKIAEAEISLMDKNVRKELVLTPEMINDNTKFDVITDVKVKTLHR